MPLTTRHATAVLLVNLGTPDALDLRSVRKYLREFLMDPEVIDIPALFRWLLVNGFILPTRPKKTLEAYQKIWSKDGSPLRAYSERLKDAVATRLQHRELPVLLGMRYGNPSIRDALRECRKLSVRKLIVLNLYPQYALSSTGTAEKCIEAELSKWPARPTVDFIPAFYANAEYLSAIETVAKPFLTELDTRSAKHHVLFSYHGLPERHILKADPTGTYCRLRAECCATPPPHCYRAQAFWQSEALARRFQLQSYSTAFQSRLGRTPWLRPYTDERVVELAKSGVEHLWVFCPSFVADCLETLEEIGIRARDAFREAGGRELTLIPALNDSPEWADAAAALIEQSPLAPPAGLS